MRVFYVLFQARQRSSVGPDNRTQYLLDMAQKIRQYLTLILIALLPLHALLVTVGTKILRGSGHAPMAMLAGWKEGLLGFILVIAFVEWIQQLMKVESGPAFAPAPSVRLGTGSATVGKKWKMENGKFDLIDGLIVALFVIALLLPKTNFLFGFKYDFIPLIAFMILRRVGWSQVFMTRAQQVILWVGGIVALYGIISFFLPNGFFTMLGYSDAHSLYLPNGPLAAFQQISGTTIRRIQSTMSGPNQFGIWLLIPLSVCLVRLISDFGFRIAKSSKSAIRNPQFFIIGGLLLLALLLTFSRSAWIAAVVITCLAVCRAYSSTRLIPKIFAAAGLLIFCGVMAAWLSPAVFVRSISLAGHIERPLQAIGVIAEHPLGLGLGAAGPASNRTHEPCVFLEEGSDPSWAQKSPELCVFVGKTQVQPAGHACNCPVLPENWYLQIGVEMGVLGLLLYLVLVGVVLRRLGMENGKWKMENSVGLFSILNPQFSIFLLFLGISIAALFLHAWEDAAVAYTAWVLIAAISSTHSMYSAVGRAPSGQAT